MKNPANLVHTGALVVILSLGCGGSDSQIVSPVVTTEAPSQFSDGEHTWKKADSLDTRESDCLSKFFATRPDLAGSPELEGPPVVFRGGSKELRFYWLIASAEGTKWACVSFVGGRYQLSDGLGNPFVSS